VNRRILLLGGLPALLRLHSAEAITVFDDCMTPEEVRVILHIRRIRIAAGLGNIGSSDVLSASAEHFVQDMAACNCVSHVMSDGTWWSDNQRNHGYTYNTYRGQVVAGGQRTARSVVKAWMDSPTHRDILMAPWLRRVGVGYTYRNTGFKHYWCLDAGGYPDARADRCA
jgi:uncharacterized protein YkwD